jgi:hypothetical protein
MLTAPARDPGTDFESALGTQRGVGVGRATHRGAQPAAPQRVQLHRRRARCRQPQRGAPAAAGALQWTGKPTNDLSLRLLIGPGGVRPWKSSSNGERGDYPTSYHRHRTTDGVTSAISLTKEYSTRRNNLKSKNICTTAGGIMSLLRDNLARGTHCA